MAAVPVRPAGGGVSGRPPASRSGGRAERAPRGPPGGGEGAGRRPAEAEGGRRAAGHPERGAEGEPAEAGLAESAFQLPPGETQRGAIGWRRKQRQPPEGQQEGGPRGDGGTERYE